MYAIRSYYAQPVAQGGQGGTGGQVRLVLEKQPGTETAGQIRFQRGNAGGIQRPVAPAAAGEAGQFALIARERQHQRAVAPDRAGVAIPPVDRAKVV